MKELQYDEMLGAVKCGSQWRFFAGTVADWILDYASYDPTYDPAKWSYQFRDGLLRVDETKAEEFCQAMKKREFTVGDVQNLVEAKGVNEVPLTVIVDFDRKLLINGFYDRAIEDYVPDGWDGRFDDPLSYVPAEVKALWTQQPA